MTHRLIEDPLFLACTRPAMVFGVPMEAMGVNVIATGLCFLVGGGLAYLLIGLALHGVFCAICRTDPNAFRLLFIWLDTKGRARNSGLWGGSSYTPLSLRRPWRPADVRHA